MSSILGPIIEHLRKSIPELEARIREMKKYVISDDRLKGVYNSLLKNFEENLADDIKNLEQFERWRNKEISEKFKKKMKLNNNLYGISGGIKCGKDVVGHMIQYLGDDPNPTFKGYNEYLGLKPKYEIKKCADKLKDCVCLILGCTRKQLEDQEFKNTELGEAWKVWKFKLDFNTNLFDGVCLLTNAIFASKQDAEKYIIEHKIINVYEIYTEYLTPRKILQLLGTEGGRMVIHPNIWVNALFTDYVSYSARGSEYEFEKSLWVITDVRFPNNEGKAVSDRNGLLIGVKRKFELRFPELANITDLKDSDDGYSIPKNLKHVDPDLYKTLTHESETAMGDHSWCDVVIENNGTIEDLFNNVLKVVQCQKEL